MITFFNKHIYKPNNSEFCNGLKVSKVKNKAIKQLVERS